MQPTLSLRVVAEGIEAAAEAEYLRQLGCRCAQGYHFGRPMAIGQFERRVA